MIQSACDCRQYWQRTRSQIFIRRTTCQCAGCSYNSKHGHTGFLLLSLSFSLGKPVLLLSFLGRQLLFAGSDHPFATQGCCSSRLVTPFCFSSNIPVLLDHLSCLSPNPMACRAGRGLFQGKTPPHRPLAGGSCLHASPLCLFTTLSWQRGSCCHTW